MNILGILVDLWSTSDTLSFNTTFVSSLEDLEVSLVSPSLVPRVGDQPVVLSVLSTVSDGLNSVSSEEATSLVDVDSRLVGEEIFIDRKGDFDWSIGGNFGFHLGNSSDRVSILSMVLVLHVGSLVFWNTLSGTRWGWHNTWARLILRTFNVVSAWGQKIWLASVLVSVEITSNQTSVDEVAPSGAWVSTIATHTARTAAGSQVLGGNSSLDGLVRSNADSVGHGFGGSESPAGTAIGLISNLTQRLALWPFFSGIKAIWSLNIEFVEVGNIWEAWGSFEEGTHQTLNLSLGHLVESGWLDGSPGSVHGVDLSSDVSDSVGVRVVSCSAPESKEGSESQKYDY